LSDYNGFSVLTIFLFNLPYICRCGINALLTTY